LNNISLKFFRLSGVPESAVSGVIQNSRGIRNFVRDVHTCKLVSRRIWGSAGKRLLLLELRKKKKREN
jgi:hypothetical protein